VSILEVFTGVYLALRAEQVLGFSETYNVRHRAVEKSWQVTDAFFVAGCRLGSFIPYARCEQPECAQA